jgi:hypothetical protein
VDEDLPGPFGEIPEIFLAVRELQDHGKIPLLAFPLQHIN